MISLKAQTETVEGKTMHVIMANSKCDEPGCKSSCVVKLSTQATGSGVVWQVESAPEGWIVSMRHSTCPICAKKNEIVLVFDDAVKPEDAADPAKVELLIDLQNKIAKLKAAKARQISIIPSPVEDMFAPSLSQLDTPFPHMQSHP